MCTTFVVGRKKVFARKGRVTRLLPPLSIFTYYRRRRARALPVVLTTALAVFGIATVVGISNSLSDTMISNYGTLQKMSSVSPRVSLSLEPNVVSEIKTNPYVASAYPENGFSISVDLVAGGSYFALYGLSQEGIADVMSRFNTHVVEGRMLKPHTNEFVLSSEIGRARGLHVGDKIGGSADERDWLRTEFVLVGLLEGEARMGFVSYEFLDEHQLWTPRRVNLLVTAKDGQKEEFDQFLEEEIVSDYVRVSSYSTLLESMERNARNLFLVIGFVEAVVIGVITLAIGMLNYIYVMQRMGEYGILLAIGYGRFQLAVQAIMGNAILAGIGWVTGMALSTVSLAWLGSALFAPKALILDAFNVNALFITLPIAILIPVLNFPIIWRILSCIDPVSIIERRE